MTLASFSLLLILIVFSTALEKKDKKDEDLFNLFGDDSLLNTSFSKYYLESNNTIEREGVERVERVNMVAGSKVCTTTALNIRSSPSTSSSIYFTSNQGEELTVRSSQVLQGNGYNWIPVSGRGYDGYAAENFITPCGVAAPCFSDKSSPRDKILQSSWALYNQRSNEHYTQDSRRWSGITNNVCPPSAPSYSDCSSASTWVYWTVFGKGNDFLNGQNWGAGYTGTLTNHGRLVQLSEAKPGDLVFYGTCSGCVSHVSIYVGNGMTISHGSDPVGNYPIDSYGSLKRQQIRNYLD